MSPITDTKCTSFSLLVILAHFAHHTEVKMMKLLSIAAVTLAILAAPSHGCSVDGPDQLGICEMAVGLFVGQFVLCPDAADLGTCIAETFTKGTDYTPQDAADGISDFLSDIGCEEENGQGQCIIDACKAEADKCDITDDMIEVLQTCNDNPEVCELDADSGSGR